MYMHVYGKLRPIQIISKLYYKIFQNYLSIIIWFLQIWMDSRGSRSREWFKGWVFLGVELINHIYGNPSWCLQVKVSCKNIYSPIFEWKFLYRNNIKSNYHSLELLIYSPKCSLSHSFSLNEWVFEIGRRLLAWNRKNWK